jgi:hypothetical protein
VALTPGPFCSQCGTPLQGSQRFCTNCGTTISEHANSPTIAASQQAPTIASAGQTNAAGENTQAATPPNAQTGGSIYSTRDASLLPPPPPPPIYNPYTNPYTNSGPGEQRSYAQTTVPDAYTPPPVITPPAQAGAYQVPAYAQKQKGNRGCATTSIVLLLVLALGIGGYFLIHTLVSASHNTANNNPGSTYTATSGTPGSTVTSTTQGTTPASNSNAASTEQLNLQFTYASISITIVSTQLASSFSDDTSTTAGSGGIVRVNLRENNPTAHNPNYAEGDLALLLFPGGTTAQAGNEKDLISPDAGVNRLNWLDFPLTNQVALKQLTLRVGTSSQSQFDIPLQANADISKYQDKTNSPGTQFKYGPLNITLKTATLSYSYSDNQATTGNRYVIITLAAVNTTTNSVNLYPGNYMRLQAGGNSIEPESGDTLPYSVNASTSASGIVAFLVPQGTTSFTLVLLAQPDASPAISQVTQNFQVQ